MYNSLFLVVPCNSVLTSRGTDPAEASPHFRILLTRAVSASDLLHEASWNEEGIDTAFSSYRLAPFTTAAGRSESCTE